MLINVLGTVVFVVCGWVLVGGLVWMLCDAWKRADERQEERAREDARRSALLEAKSLACSHREAAERDVVRAAGTSGLKRAMLVHAFSVGQVQYLDARLEGDDGKAASIEEGQEAVLAAINTLDAEARQSEQQTVYVVPQDHLDRLVKAPWN